MEMRRNIGAWKKTMPHGSDKYLPYGASEHQ
jgi:hypothetical protein